MPAQEPDEQANGEEQPRGALLGLVDYTPPPPTAAFEADAALMRSHDMVMLGELVSPRPISWRERGLWLALVASLAFHLVLVFLLPAGQRLLARQAEAQRVDEKVPPVYLFPYLPKQKVEPPSRPKAPLSDLSRRAHGGEGQPSTTPGSHGNTPEPRLEPPRGGGVFVPPRPAAVPPAGGAVVPPARVSPESQSGEAPGKQAAADQGADAVLRVPRAGAASAAPPLKGLGPMGVAGSGGAIPDRPGGQVDLGPLSFDTQWYDWGPYAAEMLRRIRYHWVIPEIAQLGVPGVVRVRFYIERTGRVTGVTIEKESDHPPMDFAARDAIVNASPLPPLPGDLTGVDREGVTITFYYNVKPPEDSRTE